MLRFINSGRYKVIEVLCSKEGYKASLCADSASEVGNRTLLVNTYTNADTIRELLPIFYSEQMNSLRSFRGLSAADGSVSAIFEYWIGESLEELSRQLPEIDFAGRSEIAESLLSAALELDLLDSRIGGRVLLPYNTAMDRGSKRVSLNFLIDPEVQVPENCCSVRLGEMLRIIFPQNRCLPIETDVYISKLLGGEYESIAAAYSAWREIRQAALIAFEQNSKETIFQYLLRSIREKPLRKRRYDGKKDN